MSTTTARLSDDPKKRRADVAGRANVISCALILQAISHRVEACQE
jgi:predicted transcriptional regulator